MFLVGGVLDMDGDGPIRIPPAQGVNLVERLEHVKLEWEKLHSTARQAMYSDSPSLVRNDQVRTIQSLTDNTVAEMDQAVTLMQKQSEAKLRRIYMHMVSGYVLSAILFVSAVVFVRTKIIVPLDHTVTALETEIAERKRTEEALRES